MTAILRVNPQVGTARAFAVVVAHSSTRAEPNLGHSDAQMRRANIRVDYTGNTNLLDVGVTCPATSSFVNTGTVGNIMRAQKRLKYGRADTRSRHTESIRALHRGVRWEVSGRSTGLRRQTGGQPTAATPAKGIHGAQYLPGGERLTLANSQAYMMTKLLLPLILLGFLLKPQFE